MPFRWNDWNLDHVTRHGITVEEAEDVVRNARSPQKTSDTKWLVWGRGAGGRPIQVVYLVDPDDTVYVIHARTLTAAEKRRFRRRRRL